MFSSVKPTLVPERERGLRTDKKTHLQNKRSTHPFPCFHICMNISWSPFQACWKISTLVSSSHMSLVSPVTHLSGLYPSDTPIRLDLTVDFKCVQCYFNFFYNLFSFSKYLSTHIIYASH